MDPSVYVVQQSYINCLASVIASRHALSCIHYELIIDCTALGRGLFSTMNTMATW